MCSHQLPRPAFLRTALLTAVNVDYEVDDEPRLADRLLVALSPQPRCDYGSEMQIPDPNLTGGISNIRCQCCPPEEGIANHLLDKRIS
jgi:hypothetical protein